MKKNTLILGIGNDILTDDGIGIKITRDIKRNAKYENTDYQTIMAGGLEIVETIKDYRDVIIIDAIRTENGIPAAVYHLTPENFKETVHISSFHDISFLEAVELGKTLEFSIPENIHIIGIEIIEDRVFSEKFSKIIQQNYHHIFLQVLSIINHILEEIHIRSRKAVKH